MQMRNANSTVSAITGRALPAPELAAAIGTLRGAIGCARPLTASPALAALTPEQAEAQLEASLAHISGQPPRFRERAMIPGDGRPIYRVIEAVVWSCPAERHHEAAAVVEGTFRAAPEAELAAALYRLRMLTRGREQRDHDDRKAETVIWLELLRCYPGDVALSVLREWPRHPGGAFWPTWHEIERELRRRCGKRIALANVLICAPARTLPPPARPDAAARVRAVEHYERLIRPALSACTPSPTSASRVRTEANLEQVAHNRANAALAQLVKNAPLQRPVVIGEGLAAKLRALVDQQR